MLNGRAMIQFSHLTRRDKNRTTLCVSFRKSTELVTTKHTMTSCWVNCEQFNRQGDSL